MGRTTTVYRPKVVSETYALVGQNQGNQKPVYLHSSRVCQASPQLYSFCHQQARSRQMYGRSHRVTVPCDHYVVRQLGNHCRGACVNFSNEHYRQYCKLGEDYNIERFKLESRLKDFLELLKEDLASLPSDPVSVYHITKKSLLVKHLLEYQVFLPSFISVISRHCVDEVTYPPGYLFAAFLERKAFTAVADLEAKKDMFPSPYAESISMDWVLKLSRLCLNLPEQRSFIRQKQLPRLVPTECTGSLGGFVNENEFAAQASV